MLVIGADMTATVSCDHAGVDVMARASQRAVTSGAELRLVVTARVVSRALSLSGLDRQVSIYPSLEAAMAASRTPAVPALVPESGGLQEHRDQELLSTVTNGIFQAALKLQAAMDVPADAARPHVAAAIGYLDGTIPEIRDAAFTTRGHDTAPPDLPHAARGRRMMPDCRGPAGEGPERAVVFGGPCGKQAL